MKKYIIYFVFFWYLKKFKIELHLILPIGHLLKIICVLLYPPAETATSSTKCQYNTLKNTWRGALSYFNMATQNIHGHYLYLAGYGNTEEKNYVFGEWKKGEVELFVYVLNTKLHLVLFFHPVFGEYVGHFFHIFWRF